MKEIILIGYALIAALIIGFAIYFAVMKQKEKKEEQKISPPITVHAKLVSKKEIYKGYIYKLYFELEDGNIIHMNVKKIVHDLLLINDEGTLVYSNYLDENLSLSKYIEFTRN